MADVSPKADASDNVVRVPPYRDILSDSIDALLRDAQDVNQNPAATPDKSKMIEEDKAHPTVASVMSSDPPGTSTPASTISAPQGPPASVTPNDHVAELFKLCKLLAPAVYPSFESQSTKPDGPFRMILRCYGKQFQTTRSYSTESRAKQAVARLGVDHFKPKVPTPTTIPIGPRHGPACVNGPAPSCPPPYPHPGAATTVHKPPPPFWYDQPLNVARPGLTPHNRSVIAAPPGSNQYNTNNVGIHQPTLFRYDEPAKNASPAAPQPPDPTVAGPSRFVSQLQVPGPSTSARPPIGQNSGPSNLEPHRLVVNTSPVNDQSFMAKVDNLIRERKWKAPQCTISGPLLQKYSGSMLIQGQLFTAGYASDSVEKVQEELARRAYEFFGGTNSSALSLPNPRIEHTAMMPPPPPPPPSAVVPVSKSEVLAPRESAKPPGMAMPFLRTQVTQVPVTQKPVMHPPFHPRVSQQPISSEAQQPYTTRLNNLAARLHWGQPKYVWVPSYPARISVSVKGETFTITPFDGDEKQGREAVSKLAFQALSGHASKLWQPRTALASHSQAIGDREKTMAGRGYGHMATPNSQPLVPPQVPMFGSYRHVAENGEASMGRQVVPYKSGSALRPDTPQSVPGSSINVPQTQKNAELSLSAWDRLTEMARRNNWSPPMYSFTPHNGKHNLQVGVHEYITNEVFFPLKEGKEELAIRACVFLSGQYGTRNAAAPTAAPTAAPMIGPADDGGDFVSKLYDILRWLNPRGDNYQPIYNEQMRGGEWTCEVTIPMCTQGFSNQEPCKRKKEARRLAAREAVLWLENNPAPQPRRAGNSYGEPLRMNINPHPTPFPCHLTNQNGLVDTSGAMHSASNGKARVDPLRGVKRPPPRVAERIHEQIMSNVRPGAYGENARPVKKVKLDSVGAGTPVTSGLYCYPSRPTSSSDVALARSKPAGAPVVNGISSCYHHPSRPIPDSDVPLARSSPEADTLGTKRTWRATGANAESMMPWKKSKSDNHAAGAPVVIKREAKVENARPARKVNPNCIVAGAGVVFKTEPLDY